MIFANTDVFSQLQPRHVSRRERKPGARERHSAQRQRLQPDNGDSCQQNQTKQRQSTPKRGNKSSAYSMDSAITDFPQTSREKHEEVVVVSRFKELSTIEDIRANMKSTSRAKSAPPTRVPEWMLNLDINLDVTSLDIIPAFIEEPDSQNNLNETYTESPSFAYVDNESENDDSVDDLEQTYLNNSDKENQTNVDNKADQRASSRSSNRLFSENITDKRRVMSNTFRIAESFSNKNNQQRQQHQQPEGSPRRYQGDKRVMSLQQGGIRSTPMQPKSKKFINQMITFHHMKHHDQKLKKAKPAIDTKMPSTFRYALERKQLVEQRLSQSWNQSEPTSPRKSPSPSKSPSNKSRDSR